MSHEAVSNIVYGVELDPILAEWNQYLHRHPITNCMYVAVNSAIDHFYPNAELSPDSFLSRARAKFAVHTLAERFHGVPSYVSPGYLGQQIMTDCLYDQGVLVDAIYFGITDKQAKGRVKWFEQHGRDKTKLGGIAFRLAELNDETFGLPALFQFPGHVEFAYGVARWTNLFKNSTTPDSAKVSSIQILKNIA